MRSEPSSTGEEIECTVRLLRSQNRLTEAILAQDDLAALGAQTVDALCEVLGLGGAALTVLEEDGPVLSLVHERGCGPRALSLVGSLNLREPGPSPGKDALLARRTLVVPCGDARAALAPLVADERLVGLVMAVSATGSGLSGECLGLIESVRGSIARAVCSALRGRELGRSKEALERLNRESREMVHSLSRANEKLEELDRMKDSFVASVSHELRTPLTSIRGFAEILLDYGVDDAAVSREFLTIIRDESERLGRLIRNILDLSRIEAGKMSWDIGPVDIEDTVRTAARVLRPQMESEMRRFTMSISPGLPAVSADRDGLIQVLVNLLGNAAKFTRPGGTISVTAEAAPEEGGTAAPFVRVAVHDDGIGIPTDDLARIFDKFLRLGGPAAVKPGGTGLGLAICKEILASFGGSIWAESRTGEGSVFTFTVPIDGSVAARAGAWTHAAATAAVADADRS